MSGLSGLPPSAIRAASLALSQDVAVRLINLPDTLADNPAPLTLPGIVKGQLPDGQLQVETTKGIVNILLKDKGALPPGQRIEIDIPAGRPPAAASIRLPSATAPPVTVRPDTNSNPNSLTQPVAGTIIPSPVKLDRAPSIRADDMAEALATSETGQIVKLPSAPLQPGQTLRLTPLPAQGPAVPTQMPIAADTTALFQSLLNMVEQTTDLPLQSRQQILGALSRIDLSSFPQLSSQEAGLTVLSEIPGKLQTLMQDLDLPVPYSFQNVASSEVPETLSPSAKFIDVQIVGFQQGDFQTALADEGQASPSVNLRDFAVMPLPPQLSAAPVPDAAKTPATIAAPLPAMPNSTPPAVAPPAAQQPTTAAASPPVLLGQVVSFTPEGQPVISLALPGGSQPRPFIMQFAPNNIVAGAPVLVSPIIADAGAPVPKPGFVPFAIGAGQSLPAWTSDPAWTPLQSLIASVGHLNPAAAQSMTQMLPNAVQPQNLGALSLFFLSVMRSGEFDSWIGQGTASLLKAGGKIDVLRALTGEAVMSQRLESTALPNDWRATMLPFWHDQQIHKLPLFYKQWKDDQEESASDRRQKLRFMFELKLSRMGPVQIDGFMAREKLDMILRTKAAVGGNMQEALRRLYFNAMERSNLSGEITFQFRPDQWVSVDMPIPGATA